MTPADRFPLPIPEPDVLSERCPSRAVLRHMTSRWGTLVLIVLGHGTHRFSEIRRSIGGISEKMLAQTLQQLEGDGLVLRVDHQVVPPHVEYSLTPLGAGAAGRLRDLADWIEGNLAAFGPRDQAGGQIASASISTR